MNIQQISITKLSSLFLSKKVLQYQSVSNLVVNKVVSFQKEVESFGYIFSPRLFFSLCCISEFELSNLYRDVIPFLKQSVGAHVSHKPMYPNFPKQVMDASEAELYTNAIIHYWSAYLSDIGAIDFTLLPFYNKENRKPLSEKINYKVLDVAIIKDVLNAINKIIYSNSSISESDKKIIDYAVVNNMIKLDGSIPFKENLCVLVSSYISNRKPLNTITEFIKFDITDVLRIACYLSGGDVSLAEPTKFKSFSRYVRRQLLNLISVSNREVIRYPERWKRLAEKLHPHELIRDKQGELLDFFNKIKEGNISSKNSLVEEALAFNNINDKDLIATASLLTANPGDFARRLDKLIRSTSNLRTRNDICNLFISVANKVSTPVLLQVLAHFKNRNRPVRFAFPKGKIGKVHMLDNHLDISRQTYLISNIEKVLTDRFKLSRTNPPKSVYIDPKLVNYPVPFGLRSASNSLKTLTRGSKINFDLDYVKNTIRFFIHWKNSDQRIDIDLSACAFNANWGRMFDVAYFNLKTSGCYHSGDITNAPNGASEFIDVDIETLLKRGVRYVAMCVNSFSLVNYSNIPECFAGFMLRKNPNSGEIFEAKTVENKIDLTSENVFCIPLVIDLLVREVVWCDVSAKATPHFSNNVFNNKSKILDACRAFVNYSGPNLHDLLSLYHSGIPNVLKEQADVVFDSATTPYQINEIASKYMA